MEVQLSNDEDLGHAEAGLIPLERVRRVRVSGLPARCTMRLVIPSRVAEQLGLEVSGHTAVKHSDGRTVDRVLVRGVRLTYAGREGVFSAIVEPGRELALIGVMVQQNLDLLVDPTGQTLVPRDPKQIICDL